MTTKAPDYSHQLAQAEALRRAGQFDKARQALEALLAGHPGDAELSFRLGQIAANAGQLDECRRYLEQAVADAPAKPEYALRLGNACERGGDIEAALRAYDRALAVDSRLVPALLRVFELELARGNTDAAVDAGQRIVLVQGAIAPVLADARVPPALRATLQRIQATLRGKYVQLRAQTRDYLAQRYAASELERIDTMLDRMGAAPSPVKPLHGPEFLYFPGLEDRPWFNTDQFEWAGELERHWTAMRDEYLALDRNDEAFQPYIYKGSAERTLQGTDFSSLAGNRNWSAFHLNKAGWIDSNCALCPRTAELMRALPLAQAEQYMPEVFFSVLAPGTEIIPHYGQTNIRLTVHLGLIVPDNCGIQAGGEQRTWQPGKLLAFDDSFEHAAWNRGDADRVVLIFEAWHPDLTKAEIDGLQHFFATRAAWLRRFGDLAPGSGHA